MNIGDIYEIRDIQVLNGNFANPILNVYHYFTAVGDATQDASDVEVDFAGVVSPTLYAIQSQFMQHVTHEVINLQNPTDFVSIGFVPPAGQGTQAGEYLPPANCWSFIYQRSTTVVRNGWKRICGIVEGAQVNGFAAAGQLGVLNAAAAAMASTLTVGAAVLQPIILRKIPSGGGGTTYFPFQISGVQYRAIGTQNTRKR